MSGPPVLAVSVADVILYVVLAAAGFLLVVVVCAVLLALINLMLPRSRQDGDPASGDPEPVGLPGPAEDPAPPAGIDAGSGGGLPPAPGTPGDA